MDRTDQDAPQQGRAVRNPYAEPRAIGGQMQTSESAGLSGTVLDRLLQDSYRRGRNVGMGIGREEAAQRYAEIFDEGAGGGIRAGEEIGARQAAVRFIPSISNALEVLRVIKGRTGSKGLRLIASEAISELEQFTDLIDAMADQAETRGQG